MNYIRWAIYETLKATGLTVEVGTGGRTKFNRTQRGLPKSHWIDAACVGKSTPEDLHVVSVQPLLIKATGHNSRQMTRMDRFGFPRTSAKGPRIVHGFRTGDIVKAVVPKGKRQGMYVGRVAIRSNGSFNVATKTGKTQGIGWRYMRRLHAADGYGYHYAPSLEVKQ
jgi:hypothetical protein